MCQDNRSRWRHAPGNKNRFERLKFGRTYHQHDGSWKREEKNLANISDINDYVMVPEEIVKSMIGVEEWHERNALLILVELTTSWALAVAANATHCESREYTALDARFSLAYYLTGGRDTSPFPPHELADAGHLPIAARPSPSFQGGCTKGGEHREPTQFYR
jgi:hypothetical protein